MVKEVCEKCGVEQDGSDIGFTYERWVEDDIDYGLVLMCSDCAYECDYPEEE